MGGRAGGWMDARACVWGGAGGSNLNLRRRWPRLAAGSSTVASLGGPPPLPRRRLRTPEKGPRPRDSGRGPLKACTATPERLTLAGDR